MKKALTAVLLVTFSAGVVNAASIANFEFWKFGYQWTTSTGNAPGPGLFSPSHVSPLSSGIGLTLTETSSGSIVGGEVRTLNRFLYGTFKWTEYVPVQVSGQISAGFLYYGNSTTEIDFEQEGNHPSWFWVTNWTSVNTFQTGYVCCYKGTIPHALKMVWKPGEIDYYIDGVLVSKHFKFVPSTAAYFMFNFWGTNSNSWGGVLTPGTRYYVVSNFSYSPSYGM
jgi:Glycosyl hydrolases family 16